VAQNFDCNKQENFLIKTYWHSSTELVWYYHYWNRKYAQLRI